ncbi:MAG: hypothetical protein ABIR66_12860, partial [Saprospiraceae bacterium]
MKPAILFVSYYYHPQLLTATRNFYLSKMLADQGFEVHILGRAASINEKDIPDGIRFHGVKAWDYRRLLKVFGFQDGITSTKIKSEKLIEWGHRLLLRYPFNFILGEGGGWYFQKAVREGITLINRHRIQFIYSSYRPITDHGIARNIKKHFPELKWIGDFRDVLWWTKNDSHYQQTWVRKMVYSMDYMTAVTKGIADFWSDIYKKPVRTLYNGLPDITPVKEEIISWKNKFVINYTGRIYTYFQRADILFLALSELIQSNDNFKADVLINYSGINRIHWEAWMNEFRLEQYAQSIDHIPVERAQQFQTLAQINVLLTWTTTDISGFIHGKYNEYLAARKPI